MDSLHKQDQSTDHDSSALTAFSMGTATRTDSNGDLVDSSQLSNADLIKKAEEFTEILELEKAVALYDEGVRRFPNDTVILDSYTDLLLQFNQHEKAKELIERSI
jgi:predicted Zn-dependent protease